LSQKQLTKKKHSTQSNCQTLNSVQQITKEALETKDILLIKVAANEKVATQELLEV